MGAIYRKGSSLSRKTVPDTFSSFDLADHGLEGTRIVFHSSRFNEYFAIEIAEHPFGSPFGTIDRDDPKVSRPSLLDTFADEAGGLADVP